MSRYKVKLTDGSEVLVDAEGYKEPTPERPSFRFFGEGYRNKNWAGVSTDSVCPVAQFPGEVVSYIIQEKAIGGAKTEPYLCSSKTINEWANILGPDLLRWMQDHGAFE